MAARDAERGSGRARPREFAVEGSDGTRLYVRATGEDGPATVLLSDGIVCDGFIYRYLWDEVARWLPVAHWHYRGHGRSAPPADPTQIAVEHHARDLNAVRAALGDPPVVLVGHSFGTQVALEAALQEPARVRALVLLCASYGRVTHTFKGGDRLATELPGWSRFVAKNPRFVRSLLGRLPARLVSELARFTPDVDARLLRPEDLTPYFEHVATLDPELMLAMIHRAGDYDARPHLGRLDVPVLIVSGERDTFIPVEHSEELARLLPRAEHVVLPGATHAAPLEQPELLALRLEKFLRQHGLLG